MYKQFLLNSIIKDMKICRRLYTKIPADQLNYKPKDEVRSTLDLLRYLSWCGTGMIRYWSYGEGREFREYMAEVTAPSKTMEASEFLQRMDEQIALAEQLFANISEEDLYSKEVTYPWGAKGILGQAIIETSIKWLAAYKMQLFLYIKYSTGQAIGTADVWVKTELDEVAVAS
jgi:hypothetical protein